ncbi:MAG: hypothetical protein IPM42_04885 [Saprospiraceae bacterium]|nr:hypothetical protein [Saprospiraceae bacterium]
MNIQNPIWTLIGFVLFAIGVLSLILSLVGLQLTPVNFIYGRGVFTLIIQLVLLFGGMILMYVSKLREE